MLAVMTVPMYRRIGISWLDSYRDASNLRVALGLILFVLACVRGRTS